MEKMYRSLVLAGLLIGLIANAAATYNLKWDLADTQIALAEVSAEVKMADAWILMELRTMENASTTQLAEHERLISQLENMMNYQMDN